MKIVSALDESQYQLWWHPGLPLDQLRPGQTYHTACDRLNHVMASQGRVISQWLDSGDRNTAARLVRANWLYHDITHRPIKKPLLVSPGTEWHVITGDTRVMAATQRRLDITLSAVCIMPVHQPMFYPGWIKIVQARDILQMSGLDMQTGSVRFGIEADEVVWLDIGDASTAGDLHDQAERENIMQDFLDNQSPEWQFDNDWIAQRLPGLDKYYRRC